MKIRESIRLTALLALSCAWPGLGAASVSESNAVTTLKNGGPSAVAGAGSSDQMLFTGSFSHTYPVDIPPGINGVQPQVAFTYSSSGGNSWVGVGWDLSFGSIQRSTKNGPPAYDSSKDTFVLSMGGASQELVSADNGATNYRAKIEGGFQRFVFDGTSWIVYDKSGTKMYFGPTAAGRTGPSASQTFSWALERVVDRTGNFYTIDYTADQGQLYPNSILYTGHTSTAEVHRRVRFILGDRTAPADTFSNYRGNFKQVTAKRLTRIETEVSPSGAAAGPWNLVRRYTCQYATRSNGTRSVLTALQVTGFDEASNTLSLPPTRFEYAEQAAPWSSPDSAGGFQIPQYMVVDGRDNGVRFAELDGDGRTDVLIANYFSGSWILQAWLNKPSGWTADAGWNPPLAVVGVGGDGHWWDTGTRYADLNGDGRADIIQAATYYTGFINTVRLNNGHGWDAPTTKWTVPDASWSFTVIGGGGGTEWFRDHGVQLVDINGDGLVDLVQSMDSDGGLDYRRVRFNTGNGWADADAHSGWQLPVDLTLVGAGGSAGVSNGVELVDVNGDGLVDVLQRIIDVNTNIEKSGTWLNRGGSWEFTSAWALPDYLIYRYSTQANEKGLRFADVNGDGLTDLVQSLRWDTQNPPIQKRVFLNTGNGWGPANTQWPIPELFTIIHENASRPQGTALVDVNGDGRADVVRAFGSFIDSAQTRKSISLGASTPELMSRVRSPLGGTTDMKFTNTAVLTGHQIPFPVNVLSSLTTDDGRGATPTVNYTYTGGLFDGIKREFLGFSRADTVDSEGYRRISYFHQKNDADGNAVPENAFKGRIYKSELLNSVDKILSRQETLWDRTSPSEKSIFVRVSESRSSVFKTDGSLDRMSSVQYAYDDGAPSYGNVVSTTYRSFAGASAFDRKEVADYATNVTPGNYLVLPRSQAVRNSANQDVRRTVYLYDGSATPGTVSLGNLTEVQQWRNLPTEKWLRSRSGYNARGQALWSTDFKANSSSTTYGADGLPRTAKNALGHTTRVTIDLPTGQKQIEIDANNISYTYDYDALGRVSREYRHGDPQPRPSVSYDYHDSLLGSPQAQFVESFVLESTSTASTIWSRTYFDGLGRTYKSENEAASGSVVTDTQFNSRGLAERVSLPHFANQPPQWSTSIYDGLGRTVRTVNPDGTSTSTQFEGRFTYVTDSLGRVHASESDAFGRVVKRWEPSVTQPTVYAYDDVGSLTSLTDSKSKTTSFTYDSLGRKLRMVDPNAGTWAYAYDDNGNLSEQTDARGVRLTFQYDALNRIAGKSLAADPSAVTGQTVPTTLASYTYDTGVGSFLKGRLVLLSNPAGSIQYYYDGFGRASLEKRTVAGTSTEYNVRRQFDQLDRPTEMTYPSDRVVKFAYNAGGQLSALRNTTGSLAYAAFPSYDAQGRPLSLSQGNGKTVTSFTYHPVKQTLASIKTESFATATPQVLRNLSYAFDNGGNLTSLNDAATPSRNQTFGYDALDRLTSAQGPYGTEANTYDSVGNILSKGGQPYTYGDPQHPNAVTATGSVDPDFPPATDTDTLVAIGMEPSEPFASFRGTVRTSTGAVARQAVVTLSGAIETTVAVSTVTGEFEFRGIPAEGTPWKLWGSATGLRSPVRNIPALETPVTGIQLTLAASTSPVPAANAAAIWGPRFDAGRYGGSLSFNGTSDIVASPTTAAMALNQFCVMLWVKPSAYPAAGTYGTLVAKSNAVALGQLTSGFRLLLSPGGQPIVEMARGTTRMSYTYTSAIPLNTWTFLTFTYDGAKVRFYANEAKNGERVFTGAISANAVAGTLGASIDANRRPVAGTFFKGNLDELRIQGRHWTSDNILAAYTQFNSTPGENYAYDAAGNMTRRVSGGSTWTYRYDAEGRLSEVKKDGIVVSTFVYDPTGARLKKITPAGTTLSIAGVYESRPNGTTVDHIVAGGQMICDVTTSSAGTSTAYYHTDHLGSVTLVTNENGAKIQDTIYKPFGETHATTGASPNRRNYTGQEEDTDTGLYYYNARYYLPALGRFISADSIVPAELDPQSLNRYTYVKNNPIVFLDPTGNSFWKGVGTAGILLSNPATAFYVGGRAAAGDVQNISDAFRYSYQGFAIQMAAGALIGSGIGVADQFIVPWVEMLTSGALAGIGYVGDKNGWNVDTTNYDAAESRRQREIDSRRRGPVTQVVSSNLFAAAGIGEVRGPIFSPLIGLRPNLRVRTNTRSEEEDDGTTLYHYGYAKNEWSFKLGLNKGAYATPDFYLDGRSAQLRLALPIHNASDSPPDARYLFSIDLGKTVHQGPSRVAPLQDSYGSVIRPGGGQEYRFPMGTGPETFRGIDYLP